MGYIGRLYVCTQNLVSNVYINANFGSSDSHRFMHCVEFVRHVEFSLLNYVVVLIPI